MKKLLKNNKKLQNKEIKENLAERHSFKSKLSKNTSCLKQYINLYLFFFLNYFFFYIFTIIIIFFLLSKTN